MSIEYICSHVERVRKKYGETDPFRLAAAMKIVLLFEAMGTGPKSCKGFYLYQSQKHIVTINSDLPYFLQRIILAHEIGHVILHNSVARVSPFHDFSMYETASQYEYEANLFAAEYLLDDAVIEKLNEDTFFFGVAGELGVPPELLDFKYRILKRKGCLNLESPIMSQSNFLKNI